MDWFERLTGFSEQNYAHTRQRLEVKGGKLRSQVNGKSYDVGELELVSLQRLRERVSVGGGLSGRLKVGVVRGDVRVLHRAPENAGALFQVASQFNLLEMTSPSITPEEGVTRYQEDGTQGPACAIAAGAATIYRNYFAPIGGMAGQTSNRQLDGLADLGEMLADALGKPVKALWSMRNGYALCTSDGLNLISAYLGTLSLEQTDALREKLCIGVHSNVEVTDQPAAQSIRVSQAFCSALPVAYSQVPAARWAPFASLVLEAAYEATMWAAVLNAQRTGSNTVLLTRLGGGVFGNHADWIDAAMRRSFRLAIGFGLDVQPVSFGPPSREIFELVADFG
ncbi:MAG: hypothetical protein Q7K57_56525 [Burkholderiaceae bacterium]|nr:hypothetical protein [Burkholderiaceae bacterium]